MESSLDYKEEWENLKYGIGYALILKDEWGVRGHSKSWNDGYKHALATIFDIIRTEENKPNTSVEQNNDKSI